jgi:hypothetical protein
MHRRKTPLRTALATIALVCLVAVLAPAALAARNLTGVPANLTQTATSPNFVVHYTATASDPNAITPNAAQQLLQTAERALGDSKSRLDLPQPMNDGDGRADVYVFRTPPGVEPGLVRADSRADRTTGWIGVPPPATADVVTVTHLVVHLQQLALYRPAGRALAEGTATWAPIHMYATEIGGLPDEAQYFPDDPIDCDDTRRCARPGYSAWRFFQWLAEEHGPQVVRAVYDRSRSLGADDHRAHFREALIDVLHEREASLARTFAEFSAANLVGAYQLLGLARRRYGDTEPFDDLATGARSRRFRRRGVALDNLSAAFYRVRSGVDGRPGRRCRRARLIVRIRAPHDLEAPLYWAQFRPRRGARRPLTLRAGRTVINVPWSTCSGREIGLAVHNPSADDDERRFTLRIELRVRRGA